MTRDEVKALIKMLSLDRPSFPRVQTQEDMTLLVNLWFDAFGEYDSVLMRKAANNFLKNNPYEPTIAGINKEVERLTHAVDESEDIEAYVKESWAAVCGSKSFDDLSPVCQAYWGSQAAIDAVGFDEGTLYTVVKAQLERRLPDIIEKQKTRNDIASDPRLEAVMRKMFAPEDPGLLKIADVRDVWGDA